MKNRVQAISPGEARYWWLELKCVQINHECRIGAVRKDHRHSSSLYFRFDHRWLAVTVKALLRLWSDHSPLILKSSSPDFGPTPFRFYTSWLKKGDPISLIRAELRRGGVEMDPPDVVLMKKLKRVKSIIKSWCQGEKEKKNKEVEDLRDFCCKMDGVSEMAIIDDIRMAGWESKKMTLLSLEDERIMDLRQKARVNMAIHVVHGRNDMFPCKLSITGVWKNVLAANWEIKNKGFFFGKSHVV
ncbi:hypothetical protein SSX86_006654 [Deinandra increscens subsp. villosa]|uniref:Uncharacterized protein n=1 Tax=Deinandra increscens subsp. villosa TaxID=3103831 RepID=A0AAP0DJX9_9ASTR